MKSIRLLPVVVMAVSALLVLKTVGLVTSGGYVLGGVTTVQAAGGGGAPAAAGGAEAEAGVDITLPPEPTMTDDSPTLTDETPTMGQGAPAAATAGHGATAAPAAAAEHGAPAGGEAAAETPAAGDHGAPVPATTNQAVVANRGRDKCGVLPALADAQAEAVAAPPGTVVDGAALASNLEWNECDPLAEGVPMQVDSNGRIVPLTPEGGSLSERALLERLAARRTELESFEEELTLRASLVDAAEKRIEERAATMAAMEAQIASLVDQRQAMETGQFAGIVAMYETMKPKDAANIFNELDMEVLLRVAKTMSPRKMAPILAEMTSSRAQELTVRMAALADQPTDQMTPNDLAALPQIVGQ